MFGISLAPLDHAEVNVVCVFLGEFGALTLRQFGAAGGIWQYRMLDHILRDRFHQRVISDCLHENRAVVVPGRSGRVYLEGQSPTFLEQAVVNILDGFEPCHTRVVDVVRLVV